MANNWGKVDATYDYVDEGGTLLYQVGRWNSPKSFGQRVPNGSGGWKYSLDSVRRVPFMLPELLRAIARGETVYVVEGEKDVLALQGLGLPATTSAQGAKYKWPDMWADFFEGAKRVVVVADNDAPGHDAAKQRAGVIARSCADTRIIESLPGAGVKDASDWIDADGTESELMAIAEAAPKAEPSKPKSEFVAPAVSDLMERWRALAQEIVDDDRIDALTPGGSQRPDGTRSLQCPLPGHSGQEATKPSAWIGAHGTSYIWACHKHGHMLLLPFLVECKWAQDKPDARRKLCDLGYTLPASPAKALTVPMDTGSRELALTELISKRNDIANGKWFVQLFSSKLRYNRDRQKWYVWDGKRWRADRGTDAEKFAKSAVDELLRHAIILPIDNEKRENIVKYALKCGTVKATQNMLKMAESEDAVDCGETDFDSDPWLLNVKNGTIDLRSGDLFPHRQEDFITKLVPVEYDPAVRSNLWEQTLLQVFEGDEETVRYFQRAIGYSITGDVRHECFFLLYGTGRNGKGTVIETLQALLKEYRETTPFDSFLAKKVGGGATPELAKLAGARIAIASEADHGVVFATAQLKNLTGGDEVSARFLYSNPFTYKPQFKIWLITNDKPAANPDDYAFWERCKVIPFNRTFEKADRDETLKARLKADLQGLLTWCVDGCQMWRSDGLGSCPAVEASTQEYRDENDHAMQWIAECCEIGGDNVATTSELTASYASWAQVNNVDKRDWLNPTALGLKLTKLGYRKDATGKKRSGIGLRAPESREPGF